MQTWRIILSGILAFFGVSTSAVAGEFTINGTGFIVDTNGYVLTAQHVVSGGGEIKVKLIGPSRQGVYQAEIISENQTQDLALPKIEAQGLPTIRIGNAHEVRRQDEVWIFGFPFAQNIGTALSSTHGRISAIQTGGTSRLSQTDAAVNPGNSGGPMVNNRGEAIGVVSSKFIANRGGITITEGLSFAVPINLAIYMFLDVFGFDHSTIGRSTEVLSARHIDKLVSPAVVMIMRKVDKLPLEQAADTTKSHKELFYTGVEYLRKGLHDKALGIFTRALEIAEHDKVDPIV